MSRRTVKSSQPKKAPAKPEPVTALSQDKGLLVRFSNWWLHFDRFSWDVVGILFLVKAYLIYITGERKVLSYLKEIFNS